MKGKIKTTLLITVLLISTLAVTANADLTPPLLDNKNLDENGIDNVGDTVTVTTSPVTMGGLVKVYWDSVKAWDGTSGLLAEDYAIGDESEIDIVIPEAATGEHFVIVKDIEASEIGSAAFIVKPEVKLTPTSGIAGDTIIIEGTGFPGSESLDMFFGDEDTTIAVYLREAGDATAIWATDPKTTPGYGDVVKLFGPPDEDSRASVYIDSGPTLSTIVLTDYGYDYYTDETANIPAIEFRFVHPDCIDPDDDTSLDRAHIDITVSPAGTYALSTWTTVPLIANPVVAQIYGNLPETGTSFGTGGPGSWTDTLAYIDGEITGFDATEWVLTRVSPQVGWAIEGTYYIDNVKVGTNTYDLERPVKTTTSDLLGSFTTTYKTSVDEAPGVKRVSMIGDIDNSFAFADFDMGTCITLTPSTGTPGTEITVLGRGFTPDETVDIKWFYPGQTYPSGLHLTVVDDYSIDSTGVFTTTFNVPLVETADYTVLAVDTRTTPVVSPTVTFSVIGVTEITLSASTGLVGDTFDISGEWFTASSTVDIILDGTVLATDVSTDIDGAFPATTVEVPDIALGSHTVTVTDEEDIYATAEFTVIEEVITIETRSDSYDPGDTISFTIESTVDIGTIVIEVYDPDEQLIWVSVTLTPTLVDDMYVVPYSAQVDDADQHLTLPSDATPGIWEWTATYTIPPDTEVTGTFTVGEAEEPEPEPVTEVSLSVGWNLVSLPLIPDDSSIEVMLEGLVGVESVWTYDAGVWYSYTPDAPSDLTDMVDGAGYWISMTATATLAVDGTEMPVDPFDPLPAYPVVEGYNLMGFKSTTPMTVSDYLLGVDYVRVYEYVDGYNALTADEDMTPGRGYWISVSEAGTIYP